MAGRFTQRLPVLQTQLQQQTPMGFTVSARCTTTPIQPLSIQLSRFVNLETYTVPPLTFGHTMPAIAYTSGKYSLPSAARVGPVRPSRICIRFSRFNRGVCLSDLKVRGSRFGSQYPLTGSLIGTQHTGLTTSAEPKNETRARANNLKGCPLSSPVHA